MNVQPLGRVVEVFQEPVPPDRIEAMCRRAFGEHVAVLHVAELGVGTYNTTYRIDLAGREPVVLRVAPDRGRQSRGGRDAMRNEYAATPYFAPLGRLVPRVLAADFTHQLVDRDHMFQAVLPGVPASRFSTPGPGRNGSRTIASWAPSRGPSTMCEVTGSVGSPGRTSPAGARRWSTSS